MRGVPDSPSTPLGDDQIQQLEALLRAVPAPLEPLDASALDGYLCGVLLRREALHPRQWGPGVLDIDAQPPPAGYDPAPLMRLVECRHRELDEAIGARRWFDPWVFEIDDPTLSPAQQVQPWVSGFALALERFPGGPSAEDPRAREPLAVLFAVFDPEDLDDAGGLLALIETLEPAANLSEAVEDLVRSVLLLADVVRPRRQTPSASRRKHRR